MTTTLPEDKEVVFRESQGNFWMQEFTDDDVSSSLRVKRQSTPFGRQRAPHFLAPPRATRSRDSVERLLLRNELLNAEQRAIEGASYLARLVALRDDLNRVIETEQRRLRLFVL